MRMRQSLSQLEAAFREENVEERARRERLRRQAASRSRLRRHQRREKIGTLRFIGLVAAIVATTVGVTIAMFEILAIVMG